MKPVGSETLQGKDKLKRILELAGVKEKIVEHKLVNKDIEFIKKAPNNRVYAIIRENHAYFIKSTDKETGIKTEDFKYVGGVKHDTKYKYRSYSDALKYLNLIFESLNDGLNKKNINVFEGDSLDSDGNLITEEKFVLKLDNPEQSAPLKKKLT